MKKKNVKSFKFNFMGSKETAYLCTGEYMAVEPPYNNLYIGVMTWNKDYQEYEIWCDLSTCLIYSVGMLDEDEIFVNVKDYRYITDPLVDLGVLIPTFKIANSGFNEYFSFMVNRTKLKDYVVADYSLEEEPEDVVEEREGVINE